MTEAWRPAPQDLIKAAERHNYTRGDQPDLTGYLVAFQAEHENAPVTVRYLAGIMGWGTTRAARIIKRAKADRQRWLGAQGAAASMRSGTVEPPISSAPSTRTRQTDDRPSTPTRHPAMVEPALSPANATPPRQSDDANATPSRAQSFVDRDRDRTEDTQKAPATRDAVRESVNGVDVRAIWEGVNAARGGSRKLTLTKERRASVKAREKEHGEGSVVAVALFVYQGTHDRARFLRERGYDSPKTWLRPGNFAEYLELAQADADPPPGPTGPATPPRRKHHDDEWAEMFRIAEENDRKRAQREGAPHGF